MSQTSLRVLKWKKRLKIRKKRRTLKIEEVKQDPFYLYFNKFIFQSFFMVKTLVSHMKKYTKHNNMLFLMIMIFFSLTKSSISKDDVMVDVLIKKRSVLPKDNAKKSEFAPVQELKNFGEYPLRANYYEKVVKSELSLSSISEEVKKYKKNLCSANKGGSFEIWFSFEGNIGMVVFGSAFETGIKAIINCAE